MSKLDTAQSVITARAKAAVKAHKSQIIQEFLQGAKDKGHNIKAKDVTSVTLKGLDGYGVDVASFDIGAFVIEDAEKLVLLNTVDWDNNAAGTGKVTFVVDKTTTDTYSWAVTAGITAGVKVTGSVNIELPGGGASVSTEVSIEASVSTTSGTAHSQSRHWGNTFEQAVDPYTHFHRDIYGLEVTGHAPYTIRMVAKGTAQITIKFSFHGNREHIADVPLTRLLGKNGVQLVQSGLITGLQGYDTYRIVSKDTPLSEAARAALPKGCHPSTLSTPHLRLTPPKANVFAELVSC